jgi:hypothetical protein
MKKQILLALLCILVSPLLAQDFPLSSTLAEEFGIFDNPKGEMILPDSSHGYLFETGIQDSLLVQRQFIGWNDHGQMTSNSFLMRFPDSISWGWRYLLKREFTYDNLARLTEENAYFGNQITNEWIPSYRYFTYYLNTSPLVDYELTHYYEYAISTWRYDDSTIYTRNAQQQIDFSYEFRWLEDSGYYKESYYHSFGYNAQGLESSDTSFHLWNQGIPTYSDLILNIYDNNGQRVERHSYYWSENNQLWANSSKDLFTYDNNGNILSGVSMFWDGGSSEWIREDSTSLVYNDDNSLHFVLFFDWDAASGGWIKDVVLEYFNSSHFVVGTEEYMPAEPLQFYPNPSQGNITLVTEHDGNFEIHSINGQFLKSYQLPAGKHNLDLSGLNPGIYILSSSNGNKPQKIIIQ